jgi:hypothetical protein
VIHREGHREGYREGHREGVSTCGVQWDTFVVAPTYVNTRGIHATHDLLLQPSLPNALIEDFF